MAMVRKIQHPGIQIEESEIGGYTRTVVMNNAYIMGFADRGPIYDYSWITTSKEFTKIYGEPQTEAEKYLFTAVQSVLNNGGTPIVARMPYDNKQCQAYKALKMKWMNESDIFISGEADANAFNNGQVKNTDTPLVDLKEITSEINRNRTFSEIINTNSLTINNKIITEDELNEVTLIDLVKQLNPYKTGDAKSAGELYDDIVSEFKINGVYPSSLNIDQTVITENVSTIVNTIETVDVKYNIYDSTGKYKGYLNPDTFVEEKSIKSSDNLYGVTELFLKVTELSGTDIAYINLFGSNSDDRNGLPVYLAASIPDDVSEILTADSQISGCISGTGIKRGRKTIYVDCFFDSKKLTASEIGSLILNNKIEQGKTVAYIDKNDKEYYDNKVTYNDIPVYSTASGNLEIVKDFMNEEFLDASLISAAYLSATFFDFEQSKEVVSINNGTFQCKNIEGVYTYDGTIEKNRPVIATINCSNLIPIISGTINGYKLNQSGKFNYGEISGNARPEMISGYTNDAIIGYFNYDTNYHIVDGKFDGEPYDLGGDIKVYNRETISGVTFNGVPAFTFDKEELKTLFEGLDDDKLTEAVEQVRFENNLNKYEKINDVNVKYSESFQLSVTKSLKDFTITDIDKYIETKFATGEKFTKHSVPSLLRYLKTIYNDARLIEKSKLNIIRLDAELLSTPEMGFKYGLYLDSEDCEISNDQYDDLVTVNQFKAVDRTIDKYGHDIDDCNFVIVDKQKTVVQGQGGNIGFFTTIIDPFDALKVQRTLVNPAEYEIEDPDRYDHTDANMHNIDYWAYESIDSWNQIYDNLLDSMDTLQRVRNADGVYIGEPKQTGDEKPNLLDSWAIPLTGGYYEESISKMIMKKFPGISMADIDTDLVTNKNSEFIPSIIDHQFGTHIMVAVCKTAIDQATGKIVVSLVETFFGSLFNEKNIQNGRTLYIGDIINGNSDYIEFYRNNYVSAGEAGAYDPPEYRRTDVNQIFIKDSEDLRNAAELRGIDVDSYGLDSSDEKVRKEGYEDYIKDLAKKHIFVIDKKDICVYNLHWEANFTSFSKKESSKIIANTANLYSVNDGTTINIAKNFLVDMDRCIKFIKNRDDIPLHFVCDAGLSTIAQFCDNVVWNPNKRTVIGEEIDPVTHKKTGRKKYTKTGGWITQPFSPDDDPDGEDRYITDYSDVATWRKVVEKIDEICSDIRKDCFAVIDAPRQLTLDGAAPKLRRSKFTNNFDKTIGKAMRYITGFNTSYSAGYYNWLRTTDQYTGKSIWIPPSTKIIGNYCYLNINNLPWLAPAGLTYGLISGCHAISHNPDYQEEDQIYMKSWNYIKQYPTEGFVVEGQKTLLGKESVFERVNVRLLFLDLERFAYNVSRTFKYQVNNTYTREQFVATLRPKFEDYTIRGGIYEYLIKVDDENNTPETIDANELRGDIFIKPARLIEFILLNFVGTTTGTDFTELALG